MDEKTFQHAVLITAAFIQNGDIRLCQKSGPESNTMAEIRDTIADVYKTVSSLREEMSRSLAD